MQKPIPLSPAPAALAKRGGYRAIYYFITSDQEVWLITLYDKVQQENLSTADTARVVKIIEAIQTQADLHFRRSAGRKYGVRGEAPNHPARVIYHRPIDIPIIDRAGFVCSVAQNGNQPVTRRSK
jgi:hypothetical protein